MGNQQWIVERQQQQPQFIGGFREHLSQSCASPSTPGCHLWLIRTACKNKTTILATSLVQRQQYPAKDDISRHDPPLLQRLHDTPLETDIIASLSTALPFPSFFSKTHDTGISILYPTEEFSMGHPLIHMLHHIII